MHIRSPFMAFVAGCLGLLAARAETAAVADAPRYGELRIYHPMPGKADAILERFRAGTWALRRKHGLNPLACWVSADRLATNAVVVQFLAPAGPAEARLAWTHFLADPDFRRLQAESEARHGKTVESVETVRLLSPASAWALVANPRRPERVFDLRLYSRLPGKEAAFRDRWRDHATRIYARQGMDSLGWWEASDPEHPRVMVALLAHGSLAAITDAIAGFHRDEEWIRIERETEAGGKLRDALVSHRLVPVDFSPLR
jgi:hypothetical protein